MRLWAYQSIAHGADGMMHFRWRTCRFGSEEYWNGILDHDNVPRRRYEEFAREGRELQRIGDRILNTVVEVKAAVLLETDQDEAHAGLSLGLPGPASQAYDAFAEMRRRHLPCGMIDARDSYQGVELLVLPSMLMMDDAFATKLRAYVEAGGVLLVTARTATKDRNNHVIAQTPPGLLADLCGMKVEEFGKIQLGEMSFTLNGHSVPAGIGYEVLSLGTAEAAATWNAAAENAPSAASGQPAITVNRLGRGAVVYVGTYLTKGNSAAIFDIAQALTRLAPLAEAPQGVEVTCRHRDGRRLLFLLNHTTSPQEVCQLPAGLSGHSREATPGTDLLSENPCTGQWTLEPYGVAIIEVN
jgi:beta-galactosidase